MIILVGNQKGGCGKSTTAVNLCSYFANKKNDVMLVDADRQSTATIWTTDREQQDLPLVHSVQKYDNINKSLIDLKKRYEIVIVDAAGRDSRELRTGMLVADILLMPFRPSQPDLDVLPKMSEILEQARDINPDLKVFALITMAPTNPMINEIEQAKEVFQDYKDVILLKNIIYDRKVYRDAMSEGKGVIEMDNKKAVTEFTDVIEELISFISDSYRGAANG
jgi:chromosome partitioning protein